MILRFYTLAFWLNTRDKNKKCSIDQGSKEGSAERSCGSRPGQEKRSTDRSTPLVGQSARRSIRPDEDQSAPAAEERPTSAQAMNPNPPFHHSSCVRINFRTGRKVVEGGRVYHFNIRNIHIPRTLSPAEHLFQLPYRSGITTLPRWASRGTFAVQPNEDRYATTQTW